MTGRRLAWLCAGLLAVGGTVLGLALAADPPQKPKPADTPEQPPKKLTAEEYRKLYPFQSLADRLDYETEPAKELKKSGDKPQLSADALNRLDQAEKVRGPFGQDMRRKTLEILHSEEAQKFIDRDGFGLSRMPTPSVHLLNLPQAETIPFAKPSETLNSDRETQQALQHGKAEGVMPSLDVLSSFHLGGESNFANSRSFGFVKDREHVAGFQPHQFRYKPSLSDWMGPPAKPEEKAKEQWLVTRLELVSLLKQKDAAVYVSKEMPRMDALKDNPTRTLSDFEKKGLQVLRGGEDIFTEATTNHIRMMGALRASKQCLECHQVRRGDLLGAFSYDMQRDPQLKGKN
jgi:hypothetical protein